MNESTFFGMFFPGQDPSITGPKAPGIGRVCSHQKSRLLLNPAQYMVKNYLRQCSTSVNIKMTCGFSNNGA